ncbi:MAG: S8 family serine peptidase, partial [Planctomycetota bacterium]
SVSDTGHLSLTTNVPKESEVAALGKGIITTWPMNMYAQVSGTSCSAAFVSGEAAMLWSLEPTAKAEQIRKIIVLNTTKIPLIERLSSFVNFGCIQINKAVEALRAQAPLLEIRRVTSFPASPVSGHPVQMNLQLWNRTLLPIPEMTLTYEMNGTVVQQSVQLGSLAVQEQTISLQMPSKETLLSIYETNPNEPLFVHLLTPSTSIQPQLRWSQIQMTSRQKIHFEIWVENQGLVPSASFSWKAFLNQNLFQQGTVPSLQPQERRLIQFTENPKNLASDKTQVLRIESSAIADPLYYVFILGQGATELVKTMYQEGNDVDFIADMPYRLRPEGSYIPLMIFLPNNGGNSEIDYLSIDSCKITLKKSPEAEEEGVVVYEDAPDSEPSTLAEGIELINEEGEIQTVSGSPDYNLFEDEKQFFRGRSAIFRIPRALFPTEDSASEVPFSFAQVHIEWSFYRILLSGFEKVDEGVYDQTLRIVLPTTEWPELSGTNFYYDTHVHTVAEWMFSEKVNLFAPEKAYGGPIQMIKESAYAIGLTESLEAVKDRVITTDHNCFFNDGKETGEEDSPDYRPTWGPTSPSSSIAEEGSTKSEWDRMKEIFGETAGEEVSFSQKQFALVPMGAHMLSYQGEHFDGTWHGGSDISEILGEGLPLELSSVLKSLATIKDDGVNAKSFTYAAHPYSSQGWTMENINLAIGLTESASDYMKDSEQFVFKGVQLFNGKGDQGLPTEDIFFDSLNPFINSAWKAGNTYWDGTLQKGLTQWQIHLARLMPYSHPTLPGVSFIRKLYISAGSDAHGDFNYSTGRLAKLLDFQSTFSVDSNAFGKARSYVFTDGIEGTSPEEKGLRALSQGSSIATDGILLYFEMDSDGKWDPKKLTYHDATSTFENTEGLMGGSGKFDGGRSMLVTKDCEDTYLKYKYATTPEFGGTVETIQIYKATATLGNRFRLRKVEGTSGISTKFITQLTAAGTLSSG